MRHHHRSTPSLVAALRATALPPAALPLALLLLASCGGGGGGGSSGARPIVPPPPVDPSPPAGVSGAAQFQGLDGLTPRSDGALLSWTPIADATDPTRPSLDYAYAVHATFDGSAPDPEAAPFLTSSAGATSATLSGIANGTLLRVVVRAVPLADPNAESDANRSELQCRVARLLYVDPTAAAGGDGKSAAQPLRRIADAVALVAGDGLESHVLLAEGSYAESLVLSGAVHLVGGYLAGFPNGAATPRDPVAHASRLVAPIGATLAVTLLANGLATRLDGVTLDGAGRVRFGIDLTDADLELTGVTLQSFTGEGILAKSRNRRSQLRALRSSIVAMGAEGLQAAGAYDVALSRCSFVGNRFEGIEFDDLSALPHDDTTFHAWRCAFTSNGDDGLDLSFDELDPLTGTSSRQGDIELVVEECRFEGNGAAGLLLDIDYDAGDTLEARTLLRANRVIGNAGVGIDLDGDQAGLFVLVGNRTVANRGGGVAFASDSPDAGRATCLIANHFDLGSGASGVRGAGPGDLIASHLVVQGQRGAALSASGTAVAANGALLPGNAGAPPPSGVATRSCYRADGGGDATCFTGPVELAHVPDATFFLAAAGSVDRVGVPASIGAAVGERLEFEDDGVVRTIVEATATSVRFEPPLATAPAANRFFALFADGGVTESFELIGGSSWLDRGDALERDLDGTITDVGLHGGRLAAFRAGDGGFLLPFVVERLEPAMGAAPSKPASIAVRFTRAVDASRVDATTFAVRRNGNAVAGTRTVVGNTITFTPSAPFTSGALDLELSADLAATSAAGAAPLALPLRWSVSVP
ncbi:MAG: Ig-like domain-containing protein [Planctomycetes bacterium]|nr:Ig-like domain-containing protein [Planctomycetota bacterium]